MGHDIYGHRPSDTENEIAYLRRSAFDNNNGAIYRALNCPHQNGGVSGMGGEETFTIDEILYGIKKLADKKENAREIKFLADILLNLDENEDSTIIKFY